MRTCDISLFAVVIMMRMLLLTIQHLFCSTVQI